MHTVTGRPPSMPSLKDVAERAKVSVMTVSNVINGRHERVGEETRIRILDAIEALGYRPQRRGRSLRLQREFAIALTIIHPDRRFLDDPYITQVAAGMSNALAQLGYALVINGAQELSSLEATIVRSASVDAMAVFASGPASTRAKAYRSLARLHHPLIILQDAAPRDVADACSILQDDATGARDLARLLVAKGARSVLFVVPRHAWPAIERRRKGVEAGVGRTAPLELLVCDEADFEAVKATIARRLDEGGCPDAIMGANDQIAIAALQALGARGLRVPSDVMVTGFNAFAFRNFSSPLLVSVSSPAYALGDTAARELMLRLDQGRFNRPRILLPVDVVPGESVRA
jgi:DNA-binding LacI/PurR family transcriptional regulator